MKEVKFETKADLARYLLDGGVLITNKGDELRFSGDNLKNAPFRFGEQGIMNISWDIRYSKYYVKPAWYEGLREAPKLCSVRSNGLGCGVRLIVDKIGSVYHDIDGGRWTSATPIQGYEVSLI